MLSRLHAARARASLSALRPRLAPMCSSSDQQQTVERTFKPLIPTEWLRFNAITKEMTPSPELTRWFRGLAECKPQKIEGSTVKVLKPGMHHPSLRSKLSSDIFVRDFYRELFQTLWSEERIALIGNPGISKSWFQLNYLYEACFGDIVPEEERPTCIIRQKAPATIELYIPKGPDSIPEAWAVRDYDPELLIDCFDPARTVYLYEPASTKGSHPCLVACRSLATVSPLADRIQEFAKDGGRLYMPVWTLPELLAAGEHLRKSNEPNKFVQKEFTVEKIRQRFDQFGGVFRHVLPQGRLQLRNSMAAQTKALSDLDVRLVCDPGVTIEKDGSKTVSHFILQYNVAKDFESFSLGFPSQQVKRTYMERVATLQFADAVQVAYTCLQAKKSVELAPALEHVVFFMLEKTVDWQQFHGAVTKESFCINSMRRVKVDEVPAYDRMDDHTLYVLNKDNYPGIEAVFKGNDGRVYAVQVKSGPKSSKDAIQARLLVTLCDKLRLSAEHQLHLIFITPTRHFHGWCEVPVDYSPATPGQLKKKKLWPPEKIEAETARLEAFYERKIVFGALGHSFYPPDVTGFDPEK